MSPGLRVAIGSIATLVLAAVVVGGILLARGGDRPDDYHARIEDHFMATCTSDADALGFTRARDFCRCAYEDLRAEVPFDRFLVIDEALREDPSAVPDVVDRVRTTCYLEVEATGAP